MRRYGEYRKKFNRHTRPHANTGLDEYLNSDFLGDNPLDSMYDISSSSSSSNHQTASTSTSTSSKKTKKINLSGSTAPEYTETDLLDDEEQQYQNQYQNDSNILDTETDSRYDKYKRSRLNEIIPNRTWFDVRKHYIQGERTVTDNGCIVSEDISLKKLSKLYHINYKTLRTRAKKENWKKYRLAYLSRISELNAGMDLDFHSQEAMTSEVAAMSALSNLTVLIDTFIQSKYGDILDTVEDTSKVLSEEDREVIASSTDVQELKQITDIVNNIYRTQQIIYNNSPVGQRGREDQAALKQGKTVSGMSNENQTMTSKQRQAMLNSIKAKLENISAKS